MIGVIADTHGLLRSEAITALRGCAVVLHAGDIGLPAILDDLQAIAPVIAVRGNIDRGAWAASLPTTELRAFEGVMLYMLHDVRELAIDPSAAGIKAVISGHSHKPNLAWNQEVLYFNPGSAGPRRFKLPITIGRLIIQGESVAGEIIELG